MNLALTLAACLALTGCAAAGYQQTLAPPKTKVSHVGDAELDCTRLESAIARTDTVRWVIRDDGGRLETGGHKAARYAANVVLVPLAKGWWEDGGHAVLDAADRRIVELLLLKRAKGCPAAPTTDPGRTDLQLLVELEPLLDAGSREALDRRTALLDGLRVVAPPVPESRVDAGVSPAVQQDAEPPRE